LLHWLQQDQQQLKQQQLQQKYSATMQVQQAATVKTLAGLHMPRMIYGTAWKTERTGTTRMLLL
jgi:hypothetical protein